MYRCLDCEETFEVSSTKVDDQNILVSTCPYCSSQNINEIYICKVCGERYSENSVCDACKENIQEDLQDLEIKYGFKDDDNGLVIMDIFQEMLEE